MLFLLLLSLLLICCNTSAEHTASTNSEDDIVFIYSSLASVKSVMTLSIALVFFFCFIITCLSLNCIFCWYWNIVYISQKS